MKNSLLLAMALAATLGAASCKMSVDSGGQRFAGAGVTFVVLPRTSKVTNGPFGIDYKSDVFNASTDGKTLLVDGKSHGAVKPGDVVDLTEVGVVKVNGVVRAADGA